MPRPVAPLAALALLAALAPRVAAAAPLVGVALEGGSAQDGAEPGVRAWLERLGAGAAHERERAQRWLGVHLSSADYPELAEAARGADPETARRLSLALGSEPRHLSLAVLLLDEREETLRAIGSEAFEDLVTRWCPEAAGRSARRADVVRVLAPRVDRVVRVARRRERLELTLDRLDRLGPLPVPLVLDPSLGGRIVDAPADEGDPLRVLAALALQNGLALVGVGDWEGEEPGRGAWILVTEQSGARARSGAAHLLSWCLAVERDTPAAASAARSLGACGWPAVLDWLDRRWRERRDEAALEGLLAAAARGRVAPGLRRLEERAALLARADAALAGVGDPLDGLDDGAAGLDAGPAQRFAERLGRGLIGAGSLALGGVDDSASLLEGWEDLGAASRWWRLWVLEGRRCGSAGVRDFLADEVARPAGAPPAVRFQALRALAAAPRRPLGAVEVGDLVGLAAWAMGSGRGEELVVLLDSLGVELGPGSLGSGEAAARLELHARLRGRREGPAATTLASLASAASAAGLDELREELAARRLDCGPGILERVVRAALGALEDSARAGLARAALLAGCLDERGRRELWSELRGERDPERTDWEAVGALAGADGGEEALARLRAALGDPPRSARTRIALVEGVGLARRALLERGRDAAAADLVEAVHLAASDEDSPLHERLSPARWPRSAGGVRLDLERLERELPPELR